MSADATTARSNFSSLYDDVIAACKTLGPNALPDSMGEAPAATQVRSSLFSIALRLISKDGFYEDEEVNLLNELFGTNHTPDSLSEMSHDLGPFVYSDLEDGAWAMKAALDEACPGLGDNYRKVVEALCELLSQADGSAEWAERDLIDRLKDAMA